jgi:hypothetical protein
VKRVHRRPRHLRRPGFDPRHGCARACPGIDASMHRLGGAWRAGWVCPTSPDCRLRPARTRSLHDIRLTSLPATLQSP